VSLLRTANIGYVIVRRSGLFIAISTGLKQRIAVIKEEGKRYRCFKEVKRL
jgi:hypothetical protein